MTCAGRLQLVLGLVVLGLAASHCDKSDVGPKLTSDGMPGGSDSTVVARLDATVLQEPSVNADPVGTVLEGDLLTVLAEQGEFSKVNVHATGTIGWLESSLCLRIPPSPYWEGDTSKAREVARRIYQDKFLVQRDPTGHVRFPVGRVLVETAFNTVTFQSRGGDPRPVMTRDDAQQLATYWLGRIGEIYPQWREPSVYVRGFDGNVEYLLTMGPDKVALFH